MSQSLQSAQQSLQRAGQQSAQAGQKGEQGEATQSEMGEEFQPGTSEGSSAQAGASGNGQQAGASGQSQQAGGKGSGSGPGMGGPGRGAGGNAGRQQPLPGPKKNELVKGTVDPRGQKLTRSYMGTPDPNQDRAAYYSVVPEKIRAAESSLNREDIPAGYKRQVRDYFDAIQPGKE